MKATTITSLSNPRVKQVVKLREHRQRRKTGLFIAEGLREIERASAAGLELVELFACDQLLDAAAAEALTKIDAAAWFDVPAEVMRKMAYVREPEGTLAVVRSPDFGVQRLLPLAADAVLLVAVQTEKPGNLGAMIRTADAAGCHGVIAAGTEVDALNPNAIRASTAAVFTMPTASLSEAEAMDWLREQGMRVLAATVDGETPHTQVDYAARPLAIVIGPEDRGLDSAWTQLAEQTGGAAVQIQTKPRTVDSLNASNAAAVLLFEAQREHLDGGSD